MNNKHILIVDDEESVLSLLSDCLEDLSPDYQVVTATDGFLALDQIERQSFDLVVADYKMPGMDGLELLEAIRFKDP